MKSTSSTTTVSRLSAPLPGTAPGAAQQHVLGTHGGGDRLSFDEAGDGAGDVEVAQPDAVRTGDDAGEEVHGADEVGDERGGRLAVDLRGRSDLLDDPVIHHHDAVGEGQGLRLIVGDHDGGQVEAALQPLELVTQVHAHPGVERAQRLVEQKQPRRHRNRPGDGDPLLLPAGELGRILVGLPGEADHVEQLGDLLRDVVLPAPLALEPVGHVVEHGEVGEQGIGLKHDAVVAPARRQRRDLVSVLVDQTAGLGLEAGDDPEQRRLAAPRRPQEDDELAAFDVEGHGIEGREVTEALGDALQAQKRPVASRGAFVLYHHAGPAIAVPLPGGRPAAQAGPGSAVIRQRIRATSDYAFYIRPTPRGNPGERIPSLRAPEPCTRRRPRARVYFGADFPSKRLVHSARMRLRFSAAQ